MEAAITNHFYKGDIPSDLKISNIVAIDTETMGLNLLRDRLCVAQLSFGDGDAHIVQFQKGEYKAPNLKKLLKDKSVLKLFHFARFDVAAFMQYLDVTVKPVYCTKIASKLVRTYTDRHGLKELCSELLGKELSKQQQSSDWGAEKLSAEQLNYAASDVLYLHKLKEKLDIMLEREGLTEIAEKCFNFLPTRAELDLKGWKDLDIFQH